MMISKGRGICSDLGRRICSDLGTTLNPNLAGNCYVEKKQRQFGGQRQLGDSCTVHLVGISGDVQRR